ncbi:MAG: nucleotidyltransferase family protein [Clostridia bacterium]|nr:nucleotidyltransferase family protein [Clostridia bacterium]
MTDTELFLIDILASYISNKKPSLPASFDRLALFELCRIHKLIPIAWSCLNRYCKDEIPDEFLESLKKASHIEIARQISKSRALENLCSALTARGIKYAVVKGITLRAIYPEPDLRISNDEDILTEGVDFDKAKDLILSLGFTERETPNAETNVLTFTDEASGLPIELHNSLFPHTGELNTRSASLFDGATDSLSYIDVDGCRIATLSPTDSFLFLVLHSFKHFVYCGFGLRQVSDFALFGKQNSEAIDHRRVLSALKTVSAEGFFDAMLSIADRYFGISPADMGFSDYKITHSDTDDLMSDIISGGAYGNSSPERIHASLMTVTSADSGKSVSFLRTLFPPYSVMKERYPFVSRHKALLPAGWVARIVTRGLGKKREYDASETVEIGRARVAMLKKYGVLK